MYYYFVVCIMFAAPDLGCIPNCGPRFILSWTALICINSGI
jgi:hypothetical protein